MDGQQALAVAPQAAAAVLVVADSATSGAAAAAGAALASPEAPPSGAHQNAPTAETQLHQQQHQDLQNKTRKLQVEIEEKNEIINYLKEELETLREKSDKVSRENLQLLKDAKRVKFLQDENDFLQDKVNSIEKLELELTRLKEKKCNELEYLNLRIGELEDDKLKAQDETNELEVKLAQTQTRLARLEELELELRKWRSFAEELEQERDLIKSKLLESIEHESRLNSTNKKVEDEVKRLRDLVRAYEEQRDEEQAANSLSLSVANDLKRFDAKQHQLDSQQRPQLVEREQQTEPNQTKEVSIEADLLNNNNNNNTTAVAERHHHEKLAEENRVLRVKLDENKLKFGELIDSNKRIREELDGNKLLISELRQDLACERSLAQKLSCQLSNFTKQIKSLDKQYFPIHDTAASDSVSSQQRQKEQLASGGRQQSRAAGPVGRSENSSESTPENIISDRDKADQLAPDKQRAVDAGQSDRSMPIAAKTTTATTTQAQVNKSDCNSSSVAGKELNGFAQNKLLSSPAPNNSGNNNKTPTSAESCADQRRQQVASHHGHSQATLEARPVGQVGSQKEQKRDKIELDGGARPGPQKQLPSPPNAAAAAESPMKRSAPAVGENEDYSSDSKLSLNGADRAASQGERIEIKDGPSSVAGNEMRFESDEVPPLQLQPLGPVAPPPADRPAETAGPKEPRSWAQRAESPGSPPAQNRSNFTRNSLPSRSVNYRHSKSSFAFLDRIRASVSATTNTKSSFNKQSNVLLTNFGPAQSAAAGGQPVAASSPPTNNPSNYNHHHPDHLAQPAKYTAATRNGDELASRHRHPLDCLLDHQPLMQAAHGRQPNGISAAEAYQRQQQIYHAQHQPLLSHQQQQQRPLDANLINQAHNHLQHRRQDAAMSPIRSSRQLSALIDPISSEQLMLSMLQRRQHAAHLSSGEPVQPLHLIAGGPQHKRPRAHANEPAANLLSEQQMALLYRQHYYHHLHQLHQMHHHVHLHHKQYVAAAGAEPADLHLSHQSAAAPNAKQHCPDSRAGAAAAVSADHCLGSTGSSQFYAPDLQNELIYANVNCKHNKSAANLTQAKQIGSLYDERAQADERHTRTASHREQQPFERDAAARKSHSTIYATGGGASSSAAAPAGQINGLPSVLNEGRPTRSSPPSSRQQQRLTIAAKLPMNGSGAGRSPSAKQASSSASSSPTSSSGCNSTNLSPSSATSSSSSINSLSASGAPMLSRTALRRTTAGHTSAMSAADRRQFSVERELIGSTPMTATLSRVGSCRGPVQGHHNQLLVGSRSAVVHEDAKTMSQQLMREPVKLQQPPPMKTSKILNIGHQQHQQQPATGSVAGQQVNLMARNLADIKLSDNLAFSSLRLAPKKSSSGSNLISSNNGKTAPADHSRAVSGSSSPSGGSARRRLLIENNNANRAGADASVGGGQKSSVRFEYGCV